MPSAAVYARYSSDNQKTTSIDDQLSVCRRYAAQHDIVVLEDHIYTDYAASGARRDRVGLSRLIQAGDQRLFELVLVDDLSRMARDLAFMLDLVWQFRRSGIGIISVADGVDTRDDDAILSYQIRGVIAEYQLRDLRKKTLRGQCGQKDRGFFVGESTFGYRSEPVGQVSSARSGRPRPEGYIMRVWPDQAAVVRRIFQDFADGQALTRIMRALNVEGVPGGVRASGGWSVATLSRMLDNQKYIGVWEWNKTHNLYDPLTGKRHSMPNPESEWRVIRDENLRIVPQPLWDAVRRRRKEVRGTFPGGRGKRGFSSDQRRRVETYPPHLLSGAMTCACCGGNVGLVSGKGSGYYGCLAATRAACDNRVRVPRRLTEDVVLGAVCDRLLDPGALRHILKRVEAEARDLFAELPDTLRQKQRDLRAAKTKQANLVAFVAEGGGDKAVRAALADLEPVVERLEQQVASLRRASDQAIRAPSRTWLCRRLTKIRTVLESRVEKSAILLRRLLCPIRLHPVKPREGRPYYEARTALDTLALLRDPESDDGVDSGAKSLRWWTRQGLHR